MENMFLVSCKTVEKGISTIFEGYKNRLDTKRLQCFGVTIFLETTLVHDNKRTVSDINFMILHDCQKVTSLFEIFFVYVSFSNS